MGVRQMTVISCDNVERDLTRCPNIYLYNKLTTFTIASDLAKVGWQHNMGQPRCPDHTVEMNSPKKS